MSDTMWRLEFGIATRDDEHWLHGEDYDGQEDARDALSQAMYRAGEAYIAEHPSVFRDLI